MSNSAAIALIDAMPTSRIIHAAAALGLAAVLTACAASTGAASSAAAPPPALDFGPCPKDLSTPYPTLTCASMPVPVDHSVPAGATTTVLVARLPARDPAKRRGTLFINPGGPGSSSAERIGRLSVPDKLGTTRLPGAVLDAYDLIGMDPRGVAHSSPISCVDPQFWQGPRPDPDSPASRDALWRAAAELAAGCAARSGAMLPHMGTADVARDMDLVRARLGERTLSYFGTSYGSYLGAVYASLFPQRVDRMLLDANVDPEPAQIWFEAGFAQNQPLQRRLAAWLRWTAEHDAVFHLGATPADTRAAFDATVAAFRAAPHGQVGVNELLGAVLNTMYSETNWAALSSAFSAFVTQHDDSGLVEAATTQVSAEAEQAAAAATAVTCVDSPWPHERAAFEARAAQAATTSPFAWWNMWVGGAACASWPVPPAPRVQISGRGLPPILMFNAVDDPGTPYAGAQAMHRALPSSTLVTERDAGRHGVFASQQAVINPAAQEIGAAYLVRGELPASDLDIPGHRIPEPTG